jgi:hypothetical protein
MRLSRTGREHLVDPISNVTLPTNARFTRKRR